MLHFRSACLRDLSTMCFADALKLWERKKTDECEPAFMGKSLKGVKDSSISKLNMFLFASYIDSLDFFAGVTGTKQ